MLDTQDETSPVGDLRSETVNPNVQILQMYENVPEHLNSATVVVSGT